jgi:hypothetical protein
MRPGPVGRRGLVEAMLPRNAVYRPAGANPARPRVSPPEPGDGLRRMHPTSEEARKAIDNCWVSLNDHRGRTNYGTFRRGGYPLGSGGMESSNTCVCHVRLKRSGAWWYEASSIQRLALRCAQ